LLNVLQVGQHSRIGLRGKKIIEAGFTGKGKTERKLQSRGHD
jgi:hypothetical protein